MIKGEFPTSVSHLSSRQRLKEHKEKGTEVSLRSKNVCLFFSENSPSDMHGEEAGVRALHVAQRPHRKQSCSAQKVHCHTIINMNIFVTKKSEYMGSNRAG